METRDFNAGFFGGRGFGGNMNDCREKWSKMTSEEKVEMMDKRMNSMNNDESRHGFFGHGRELNVESIDKRCEEWMKLTSEEKEKFIKEKNEWMNDFHSKMSGIRNFFGKGFGHHFLGHGHGHSHEHGIFGGFQEKWSKMTPEEKVDFINKREEHMKSAGFGGYGEKH